MIEVEHRALLNKESFEKLEAFLKQSGEDLGEDNKELTYFLFPGKLFKIVKNTSKAEAKISLKLGRFGQGADAEEHELKINPEDVAKAIALFEAFGFKNYGVTFNERHNYKYKGIEFALKYSDEPEWGYHLEMEVLIDKPEEKAAAEAKIKSLARELNVKLMTDGELIELEQKIIERKSLKEN